MLRPNHAPLLPDSSTGQLADAQAPLRSRFHDVLWAAGVLLIVVMAVFQVYDVLRRLEIVVETEQHRFLNLVRALGEQTANTLQTVDVLLREAVEDSSAPRLHRDSGAIEARLRARIAGLPQIVSLTIEQVGARSVSAYCSGCAGAGRGAAWRQCRQGPADARPVHLRLAATGRPGAGHDRSSSPRRGQGRRDAGCCRRGLEPRLFPAPVFRHRPRAGQRGHPVSRRRRRNRTFSRAAPGRRGGGRGSAAARPAFAGPRSGNDASGPDRRARADLRRAAGAGLWPGVGASVEKSAVLAPWYVQAMHSAVRTTLLCLSVALLMWLVLRQLRRRERAEQRLLVQTALLDELFESAPEAIVMVDRQQRVTRVNREFTAMFGYSAEEAQGRTLDELIVPQDSAGVVAGALPGCAGEHTAAETERVRKDGSRLHVSMLAAPILTGAGPDRELCDLPRHHRAQAGGGRACQAGVEAAPGREAGGDRDHGRRDRARLRQRPHARSSATATWPFRPPHPEARCGVTSSASWRRRTAPRR